MSDLSMGSCNTNFGVYESCPAGQERYPLSQPLNFYEATLMAADSNTNLNNIDRNNIEAAKNSCLDWFKSLCFSVIPTEKQATVLLDQCAFKSVYTDLPRIGQTRFQMGSALFRDFLGLDNTVNLILGANYVGKEDNSFFRALTSLNLTPDVQTVLKIQKLLLEKNNKDAQPLLKDIEDKPLANYARLLLAEQKAAINCNSQEIDPLLDATDTSTLKKIFLKRIINHCKLHHKSEFAEKHELALEKLLQEEKDPVFDAFENLESYLPPEVKEVLDNLKKAIKIVNERVQERAELYMKLNEEAEELIFQTRVGQDKADAILEQLEEQP